MKRQVGLALSAPIFAIGAWSVSTQHSEAQQPPNPQAIAQLGKALFFDTELSNPKGMACATCHNPATGYTYPESPTNLATGEVPGAVPSRFGNRKPPTISYARFIPHGPATLDPVRNEYRGGLFWDGRAQDLPTQAGGPLVNPNEMNNIVHNLASPALVVQSVATGHLAAQFRQVFGPSVFQLPTQQVFQLIVQSIATWEQTPEVSPFNSKYDAYLHHQATLTPQEMEGLQLFTGSVNGLPNGPRFIKNAQCSSCHALAPAPGQPDLFTNQTYKNDGIPRNAQNPFYTETNAAANPLGYNPLGINYVDYGLGDYLYPLRGLPSGDLAQGDPLAIDGTFKIPTLRNVDKRPTVAFVKAYGHNGFFKSLKQIVHFYNTRNLTTFAGEVINFAKPNPYLGLKGKPLWPAPEFASPKTLQNPTGTGQGPGSHLGNLGLTDAEENDIVAFLKTLSDGNGGAPPPPPPPGP
jgi:cytochrome c peroxidase